MKKFKKVIPALCMLLVSAIMLGSTTYAWFSMNSSVKAENMSVAAMSKTTYLMIGKNNTSEDGFSTKADFTATAKTIYPCAYTEQKIDVDGTETISAKSWYTANSTEYASSNNKVTNYQTVDLANNNYFLLSTVYLKMSADSVEYTGKMKMTFERDESAHAAIKAVVKIGETVYHFNDSTNSVTVDNITIKNTTNNAVEVGIYVYIDGTHENVNSSWFNQSGNANKLQGSVNVGFELNPSTT